MDLTPPNNSKMFSIKPNHQAPALNDIAELKAQLLQDIGQPNLDMDNCEC